jgi:hypothetical protein
MFSRIFPKQFDNIYPGHWLGLLLFVPIVLVKGAQGIVSMSDARYTMTTADRIPLESISPAVGSTMLGMFALLGMYVVIVPLLSAVALIRYRAMIPLMYVMFLIVQLGARGLQVLYPIPRSGTEPISYLVNLAILAVTVIGLVLSLVSKQASRAP